MTEQEWLACTDPQKMLEFLQGRASDRQFQLFSCGCCRQIWHLLTAECSREAVEVSERYADGRATENEVAVARECARDYFNSNYMHRNGPAYAAAYHCSCLGIPPIGALKVYEHLRPTICPIAEPLHDYFFCHVLRDILGNPFRPPGTDPTWLTWNDRTVVKVAQANYDNRAFDRMPVFADALEDAGCTNADILSHCRGAGPHVRGCWVVDLIQGKQ